jgi:hypothetical protein
VPELKPAGDIVIAVIVADLVLLQLVWKLYNLLAQFLAGRRQSSENDGQRCSDYEHPVNIAMPPLLPSKG